MKSLHNILVPFFEILVSIIFSIMLSSESPIVSVFMASKTFCLFALKVNKKTWKPASLLYATISPSSVLVFSSWHFL